MEDEAKMSAYQLLKVRTRQLQESKHEADGRVCDLDDAHRKILAAFKVERTNQVRNLNKAKTVTIAMAQIDANDRVFAAQAKAHKIVDEAQTLANAIVEAGREAAGAEFNAKTLELATVYERDHAKLVEKQASERASLVRAADVFNAGLAAQVEKLKAQVAEENAQAQKLVASVLKAPRS